MCVFVCFLADESTTDTEGKSYTITDTVFILLLGQRDRSSRGPATAAAAAKDSAATAGAATATTTAAAAADSSATASRGA